MKTYKVAIIGTGKIAGLRDTPQTTDQPRSHAQAVFNNPNLEIIAAVGQSVQLADFSKKWVVPHSFENLTDFLHSDLQVDILVIATPNETHAQIVLEILKTGKYKLIFVEKPLCVSEKELIELLDFQTNTKIIVNHSRRFCEAHQKIFELIKNQTLGKVLKANFTYYGGWLVNGIHILDMLMYWFGNKFTFKNKKIQAFGRENDPCIEVDLDFGNFEIQLKAFDENYYQLFEGEIYLSEGRIIYRDFGSQILIEKVEINHLDEKELVLQEHLQGLQAPFRNAYQQIVLALENKENNLEKVGIGQIRNLMQGFFELKKL